MKKNGYILTAVMAVSLIFLAATYVSSRACPDYSDTTDTQGLRHLYEGDTICQFDGKTLVMDVIPVPDEADETTWAVITKKRDTPVDTCLVDTKGDILTEGGYLKVTAGADTLTYDLKQLPKTIHPESELFPIEVRKYSYTHSFLPPRGEDDCNFEFSAYLPEHPQAWLLQFIATMMRHDVVDVLFGDPEGDGVLNEYQDLLSGKRKNTDIDAVRMTPEQIARHYAAEFERLYRIDYCAKPDSDEDNIYVSTYEYYMYVVPVWQSRNGGYITYRFFVFDYTGGAHGYNMEYNLTFDTATGRLLGFDDLFPEEEFKNVINALYEEIRSYRKRNGYATDVDGIAAMKEDETFTSHVDVLKQKCGEVYYPRPALTRNGVVLSYQPYEVGSFAEGVLHFVVPYNKVRLLIDR